MLIVEKIKEEQAEILASDKEVNSVQKKLHTTYNTTKKSKQKIINLASNDQIGIILVLDDWKNICNQSLLGSTLILSSSVSLIWKAIDISENLQDEIETDKSESDYSISLLDNENEIYAQKTISDSEDIRLEQAWKNVVKNWFNILSEENNEENQLTDSKSKQDITIYSVNNSKGK
ncbi:16575_t:CDS:2 [Racocetra persica]|uniref:16575_t:CDS:1 n=1 Tax=Racocetra persica TaxID=160502 RepID=A0ACA9K9S7_9GLOM|nr:16575_t:CDS:2 [Racocetra persica]